MPKNSFSIVAWNTASCLPRSHACLERLMALAFWQGVKKAAEAAFYYVNNRDQTVKLSPQPQESLTFGLLNLKVAFKPSRR